MIFESSADDALTLCRDPNAVIGCKPNYCGQLCFQVYFWLFKKNWKNILHVNTTKYPHGLIYCVNTRLHRIFIIYYHVACTLVTKKYNISYLPIQNPDPEIPVCPHACIKGGCRCREGYKRDPNKLACVPEAECSECICLYFRLIRFVSPMNMKFRPSF